MKVRFSVTLFAPRNARVALCGSLPVLGEWKAPIPLSPLQSVQYDYQPSMWTTTVDIPDGVIESKSAFEYKFIRWASTPLPQPESEIRLDSELEFPQPVYTYKECAFPIETELVWEACGATDNRRFIFDGESSLDSLNIHAYNPKLNMTPDQVYSLPVALFREAFDPVSEASHTTRYYKRLKQEGQIQFDQIMSRLYVGTCPRSKQQIQDLQAQQKITDFMNFQTLDDIVVNYPDPEGTPEHKDRSISKVFDLFDSLGIRYIWLPTTDMCSAARARVIAQAAFLLAALLQRPDCTGVYLHCNAGVGRSVACVSGYLHCCLNVPIRLTNLLVNAKRPVAFFDEPALVQGAKDFRWKFEAAAQLFHLPRLKLEDGKSKKWKLEDGTWKSTSKERLNSKDCLSAEMIMLDASDRESIHIGPDVKERERKGSAI